MFTLWKLRSEAGAFGRVPLSNNFIHSFIQATPGVSNVTYLADLGEGTDEDFGGQTDLLPSCPDTHDRTRRLPIVPYPPLTPGGAKSALRAEHTLLARDSLAAPFRDSLSHVRHRQWSSLRSHSHSHTLTGAPESLLAGEPPAAEMLPEVGTARSHRAARGSGRGCGWRAAGPTWG